MVVRNTKELADVEFDVLVVGAGAAGAAIAREATLRGYRTALIEQNDFGSGTSAHCYKVVHGGIRYLQHADIARLRSSCVERALFLRIAPHLVSPMPFVVPTYGSGRRGKAFLGAGMMAYDLLSSGCNAVVKDPARRIRRTRFLGRSDVLRMFPEVNEKGLSGAAVFEDGQMDSPPRLVLAFVTAAAERGAVVANYVKAVAFRATQPRRWVASVRDVLTDDRFEIRAKTIVSATGSWTEGLLEGMAGASIPQATYSRDACFLICRPAREMALAIAGANRDADAILTRGARHLLLMPWKGRTLAGVWHRILPREPDTVRLERHEVEQFVSEINASQPRLELQPSEVTLAGFGLVPFGEDSGGASLSFGKRSRVIDLSKKGIGGFVSVESVRFTVARRDAETVLDALEKQGALERARTPERTAPLTGGDIEDFDGFVREVSSRVASRLGAPLGHSLAKSYGTRARNVVALGESAGLLQPIGGTDAIGAEVAYAVSNEMAQRLTDVVFRRTSIGTTGHPGSAAMNEVAALMQRLLDWSDERTRMEREVAEAHFVRYLGDRRAASSAGEAVR
jgi:glycerol-3-phosphate dehydrogenase